MTGIMTGLLRFFSFLITGCTNHDEHRVFDVLRANMTSHLHETVKPRAFGAIRANPLNPQDSHSLATEWFIYALSLQPLMLARASRNLSLSLLQI